MLIVGREGSQSLPDLLAENGVVIGESLGAVKESLEGETITNIPRFRDAYSIVIDQPNAAPIFKKERHTLCSLSKLGTGKLVLLADPNFFSKKNFMTSPFDSYPGNSELFKEIQAKYLQMDFCSTKPEFLSPPKKP